MLHIFLERKLSVSSFHLYLNASACPNLLFLQLVKLAKRLKKEKVNVDIINFGEEVRNSLLCFVCIFQNATE